MTEKGASKRVLIIRNANAWDFGGAERFAVDLAREVYGLGWQPLVVSRSEKLLGYAQTQHVNHKLGLWWRKQNWNGSQVVLFPIYLLWQLVLTVWYLWLILKVRPGVVHPQSKDDFIAATVAARLTRKRVVWTDHADLKYIFANHNIWYKNPVGKLVYLASKLAYKITVVSVNERNHIAEALGKDPGNRFVVVYNGASEKSPDPSTVDREAGTFVYCATSRLVYDKGIAELIKAFSDVHDYNKNARLWLVGDGPDKEKLLRQANGAKEIVFWGHKDNPLDYVASCDVFVHPSYHEGFSLSIIEAAMLAKPIVACNVGGNPEIVEDDKTGLLVHARDSLSLTDAMLRLYENKSLRDKLAGNAHKSYEKSFRFEMIVKDRFMPLYEAD